MLNGVSEARVNVTKKEVINFKKKITFYALITQFLIQ